MAVNKTFPFSVIVLHFVTISTYAGSLYSTLWDAQLWAVASTVRSYNTAQLVVLHCSKNILCFVIRGQLLDKRDKIFTVYFFASRGRSKNPKNSVRDNVWQNVCFLQEVIYFQSCFNGFQSTNFTLANSSISMTLPWVWSCSFNFEVLELYN